MHGLVGFSVALDENLDLLLHPVDVVVDLGEAHAEAHDLFFESFATLSPEEGPKRGLACISTEAASLILTLAHHHQLPLKIGIV